MMRYIYCLFFIIIVSCATRESGNEIATTTAAATVIESGIEILAQVEMDTLKGSLKAITKGIIGTSHVQIDYHSPAVRERIVWGGLVPYGKVWVAGAHMATSIQFDKEITIANTAIPAGKYALFLIPDKTDWTLIINKNWKQHLTDNYDPKEDVVRVSTTANSQEVNQERLRYTLEAISATQGKITFEWEKVKVSVPFMVAAE